MALDLPSWLQWASIPVVGQRFPKDDEEQLKLRADYLFRFAQECQIALDSRDVHQAVEALDGKIPEQLLKSWEKLAGSPQSQLAMLVRETYRWEQVTRDQALNVDNTKLEILMAVVWYAAQVIAIIAAAITIFRFKQGNVKLLEKFSQNWVTALLEKYFLRSAKLMWPAMMGKEIAGESLQEGLGEFARQVIQGWGDGTRDRVGVDGVNYQLGIDGKRVLDSFFWGGIGGALGGAVQGIVQHMTIHLLKKRTSHAGGFGPLGELFHSAWRRPLVLAQALDGAVTQAVVNTALPMMQGQPFKWENLYLGFISGAFTGGTIHAGVQYGIMAQLQKPDVQGHPAEGGGVPPKPLKDALEIREVFPDLPEKPSNRAVLEAIASHPEWSKVARLNPPESQQHVLASNGQHPMGGRIDPSTRNGAVHDETEAESDVNDRATVVGDHTSTAYVRHDEPVAENSARERVLWSEEGSKPAVIQGGSGNKQGEPAAPPALTSPEHNSVVGRSTAAVSGVSHERHLIGAAGVLVGQSRGEPPRSEGHGNRGGANSINGIFQRIADTGFWMYRGSRYWFLKEETESGHVVPYVPVSNIRDFVQLPAAGPEKVGTSLRGQGFLSMGSGLYRKQASDEATLVVVNGADRRVFRSVISPHSEELQNARITVSEDGTRLLVDSSTGRFSVGAADAHMRAEVQIDEAEWESIFPQEHSSYIAQANVLRKHGGTGEAQRILAIESIPERRSYVTRKFEGLARSEFERLADVLRGESKIVQTIQVEVHDGIPNRIQESLDGMWEPFFAEHYSEIIAAGTADSATVRLEEFLHRIVMRNLQSEARRVSNTLWSDFFPGVDSWAENRVEQALKLVEQLDEKEVRKFSQRFRNHYSPRIEGVRAAWRFSRFVSRTVKDIERESRLARRGRDEESSSGPTRMPGPSNSRGIEGVMHGGSLNGERLPDNPGAVRTSNGPRSGRLLPGPRDSWDVEPAEPVGLRNATELANVRAMFHGIAESKNWDRAQALLAEQRLIHDDVKFEEILAGSDDWTREYFTVVRKWLPEYAKRENRPFIGVTRAELEEVANRFSREGQSIGAIRDALDRSVIGKKLSDPEFFFAYLEYIQVIKGGDSADEVANNIAEALREKYSLPLKFFSTSGSGKGKSVDRSVKVWQGAESQPRKLRDKYRLQKPYRECVELLADAATGKSSVQWNDFCRIYSENRLEDPNVRFDFINLDQLAHLDQKEKHRLRRWASYVFPGLNMHSESSRSGAAGMKRIVGRLTKAADDSENALFLAIEDELCKNEFELLSRSHLDNFLGSVERHSDGDLADQVELVARKLLMLPSEVPIRTRKEFFSWSGEMSGGWKDGHTSFPASGGVPDVHGSYVGATGIAADGFSGGPDSGSPGGVRRWDRDGGRRPDVEVFPGSSRPLRSDEEVSLGEMASYVKMFLRGEIRGEADWRKLREVFNPGQLGKIANIPPKLTELNISHLRNLATYLRSGFDRGSSGLKGARESVFAAVHEFSSGRHKERQAAKFDAKVIEIFRGNSILLDRANLAALVAMIRKEHGDAVADRVREIARNFLGLPHFVNMDQRGASDFGARPGVWHPSGEQAARRR